MYSAEIQNFIDICQWEPTKFLFISKNVFDPFIYYSHLLPLILSLLLGILIVWKSPKLLSARILLFVIAGFSIWTFFDLILWATGEIHQIMALWSIINLVEVFIYAGSFYFLQSFIYQKDSSLKSKILLLIPLIPVILLTPTNLSLSEYDLSNCWREAVEGPLTRYNYLIEVIFVLAMVIYGLRAWHKMKDNAHKKRVLLATVGTVLFLLTLAWGNLVGTFSDNWQVAQWGLFGMPILIAFLGYLIAKFKAFHMKVFSTQLLVAALWIIVAAILFVQNIDSIRVVISLTLVLAFFSGVALVRSVKREIKQRERLEEVTRALGEANVKLKKADQMKSEFLSFASHDLKSPVAKMKQWAALIRDKTIKEPEKILETAAKIEHIGDNALRLVEEFLNIRKIEEGKMDYNLEEVDFVDFAKKTKESFDPIAQHQGLKLTFETSAKELPLKIDKIKVRQVIENLIENSLKYTEKGHIAVKLDEEEKSALLTIEDSGLGIKKEIIHTLFEQFHRAPGEAKKIKGTGLGLYIAKQIVRAHHGEIWAESDGEGKGSRFYVRLPK